MGTLTAGNYSFTFVNGVLSVTPATLTVTANPASRAYGASVPAYSDTITGFVLSQTLGNSGVSGCQPEQRRHGRQPSGHVHDHRRLGHADRGELQFTFANGVLSVTPATLTVTANPASRAYGASDPAYSDTITGFVLGQTLGNSGVSGAPSRNRSRPGE